MSRSFMVLATAAVVAATVGSAAASRAADVAPSEAVVRQYLAAWDARDVEGMLRTFAADAVVVLPQRPPVKGRENLRPLLAAFVTAFSQPGSSFAAGQFTAEGDIAYFLWKGDTPAAAYPFGADTFVVRNGAIGYLTLAFVAEPRPAGK